MAFPPVTRRRSHYFSRHRRIRLLGIRRRCSRCLAVGAGHVALNQIRTISVRLIAWLVTGSYLDFTADNQEWSGTTVRFDIEAADGGTRVTFTHEGLEPEDECYDLCSNAWGMFMNASLKALSEAGEGKSYSFDGDEALTATDHAELHHQVAEAARPANDAN